MFRCANPFKVSIVDRSLFQETDELFMCDSYLCLAAGQQPFQLLNINRMAAEIQGYWHGERHKPDILAGKEQDDEIRVGVGYESNVIAAFQIQTE